MKTALIGASVNPDRYAYKATISLQKHGHEVVLLSIKPGDINGISFKTDKPFVENVDTITLYVSPQNQAGWYDYIFNLQPRRIIGSH